MDAMYKLVEPWMAAPHTGVCCYNNVTATLLSLYSEKKYRSGFDIFKSTNIAVTPTINISMIGKYLRYYVNLTLT